MHAAVQSLRKGGIPGHKRRIRWDEELGEPGKQAPWAAAAGGHKASCSHGLGMSSKETSLASTLAPLSKIGGPVSHEKSALRTLSDISLLCSEVYGSAAVGIHPLHDINIYSLDSRLETEQSTGIDACLGFLSWHGPISWNAK